ncbi:MAG TPA: c-type cytochrome [Gemmatimonadaceae bacterium]|nr:c-type cytochrome [Gemmatimonadaceae bacterium]
MLMVVGVCAATACTPDEADSKVVPRAPDSTRAPIDTASVKRDSAPPVPATPSPVPGPRTTPSAAKIDPGSTRLGVYTAAQAAEGYDVYLGMCNSCHAGLGNHSGEIFKQRWGDRALSELFDYMSEYMPKNDPGSLSPEDNARVIAYLLKVNGMPAGKTALPTDHAALERLWMDTVSTKK